MSHIYLKPLSLCKKTESFKERLIKKKKNIYNIKEMELIEETKEEKNVNCHDLLHLLKTERVDKQLTNLKLSKSSSMGNMYKQDKFLPTIYSEKGSFLGFFSKLHKEQELKRKGAETITPSFNFLKEAKKLLITPNPTAIVKREGDPTVIDLSYKRMGDSYLMSVASGLSVADHVSTLFLCENRLTDLSIINLCDIIKNNVVLCKNITRLDLSYNKIGNASVEHLITYMDNVECSLSYLNMEGNCLGNLHTINILNQINRNLYDRMKYLNFGANLLNDECAREWTITVGKCEYLQVLILYQNEFKNFGASLIMSEIKKHEKLKFLDISWNLIGSNLNEETQTRDELIKGDKNENHHYYNAQMIELGVTMEYPKKTLFKKPTIISRQGLSLFCLELCELFKNPDNELIHLDISHNNIGYTDCVQIAQDVKNNHTILGIHVDGNDMWINELGFIFPIEKTGYQPDHFASSHIFYRIDKKHPLIRTKFLNIKKIRGKNNCWICEGWNEVKFTYKPQPYVFEHSKKVECKLFLDFENYKPYDLDLVNDNFVCYRMCPPGTMNFFFTCNGVPCDNYGEKGFNLKEAIVHDEIIPKNEDEDENENENETPRQPKQYIITKVAQSKVIINPNVIENERLLKLINFCEPRPCKKIQQKKRAKTPWIFPISIWAYYGYNEEGENKKAIEDAFEFDFQRGQYNKDKELSDLDQLNKLKDTLRAAYPKLLESYRNYAAVLGWKIWQIGQNSIADFASSCPGLLEPKYVINDVLVKLTEVKSNVLDKEERKKNSNIPDNIIRHQWMMLLYKIAKDKYYRTKIKPTIPEAVQYSFDAHFMPFLNSFNNQNWRKERYYNEFVDNICKAYIPIFDAVYKSNTSQKQVGRKESNSMWLDEFTNIVNALMDSEFPVKEIPLIFNLSMKLQVNEIDYDRHYNMQFPEFFEAFCRFVDRLSPIPYGEDKYEWPMQRRSEQLLYLKLETVIPNMYKLITNPLYKNVKERFPTPSRDPEYNLLVYDPSLSFYIGLLPKPIKISKFIV